MEELKEYSELIQNIHTKLLNGPTFDVIPKEELSSVKAILRLYFAESAAEELSCKLQSRNDDLTFKVILVNCFTESTKFLSPVVKILEGERAIFYDSSCRKYKDWEDFLSNNVLPKCQMMYPKNGTYVKDDDDVVILEKRQSPAKNILRKIGNFLYQGADTVSLLALTLPMFTFANPFNIVAKVIIGISNGYKVSHHTYELFDRFVHDQSINFTDKTAAQHWYLIGKGILAFSFAWIQTESVKIVESFSWNNILLVIAETIKNALSALITFLSGTFKMISRLIAALLRFFSRGDNKFSWGLLSLNDNDLTKINQDVRSKYAEHAVNNKFYEFLSTNNITVANIVEEVDFWKKEEISDRQLEFRTTEIFRGGKKYETVTEMCSYFGVDSVEQVQVNGRKIFDNLGNGHSELERLVENSSGRYPKLLWYAIIYASEQGDAVNWNDFKSFFMKTLAEEAMSELKFVGMGNDIEWMRKR